MGSSTCYIESIFILLGMLVGFRPLLWAMFDCYFVNSSSGPWSIKLIMGPVLLIYMLNAAKLVIYLCRAFISYSEEKTFIQTYLHNAFKVCGVPTEPSRNDDCRRWLAQLPLICLSIISIIIVYYVSQLGSNKCDDDDVPPSGDGCTCSKDGLAEETAVSNAVVSGTSKCNKEKVVDSDVRKNPSQDVHRSKYVSLAEVIRNSFQ